MKKAERTLKLKAIFLSEDGVVVAGVKKSKSCDPVH
jgi:hypothetical protein